MDIDWDDVIVNSQVSSDFDLLYEQFCSDSAPTTSGKAAERCHSIQQSTERLTADDTKTASHRTTSIKSQVTISPSKQSKSRKVESKYIQTKTYNGPGESQSKFGRDSKSSSLVQCESRVSPHKKTSNRSIVCGRMSSKAVKQQKQIIEDKPEAGYNSDGSDGSDKSGVAIRIGCSSRLDVAREKEQKISPRTKSPIDVPAENSQQKVLSWRTGETEPNKSRLSLPKRKSKCTAKDITNMSSSKAKSSGKNRPDTVSSMKSSVHETSDSVSQEVASASPTNSKHKHSPYHPSKLKSTREAASNPSKPVKACSLTNRSPSRFASKVPCQTSQHHQSVHRPGVDGRTSDRSSATNQSSDSGIVCVDQTGYQSDSSVRSGVAYRSPSKSKDKRSLKKNKLDTTKKMQKSRNSMKQSSNVKVKVKQSNNVKVKGNTNVKLPQKRKLSTDHSRKSDMAHKRQLKSQTESPKRRKRTKVVIKPDETVNPARSAPLIGMASLEILDDMNRATNNAFPVETVIGRQSNVSRGLGNLFHSINHTGGIWKSIVSDS